jgi:hypothetical protein
LCGEPGRRPRLRTGSKCSPRSQNRSQRTTRYLMPPSQSRRWWEHYSAIRLRKEAHAGAVALAVAGALAGVFESGVVDSPVAAGAEFAAEGLQFFRSEAASSDGGFFLFGSLSGHRSSVGCSPAARTTLAGSKKTGALTPGLLSCDTMAMFSSAHSSRARRTTHTTD